MAPRIGVWTRTEFAIFNVGMVANLVGLLLAVRTSGAASALGFLLMFGGLGAWGSAAARMLLRLRLERTQF